MKGLEAVRARHLAEQRSRAESIVASAREAATKMLAQAEVEAAAETETAQREGEQSADLDTGRDWTGARRHARGIVLSAQRDVYGELRLMCADAVRRNPRFAELQLAVADRALRRLGPGAGVVVEGDTVVVARKHRRVRWAVTDTVDESLQRLGDEVAALWR